jgi:hypothetical protein
MKYQTIQKTANDLGVDTSHIRKMIKNKDITPYQIDGYKRIYVDVNELQSIIKPVNTDLIKIDLDKFLI